MRKLISVLALVASVGIVAVAATPLETLNAELDRIIGAFRNAETTAELKFTELKTDATRALNISATAVYRKVGSLRAFGINIEKASYEYGTGATPTTQFKGGVEVDLTQFVSQDDINHFGADFEKTVQELGAQFGAEYGAAATVETKVINVGIDANNNYTSLAAQIVLKIDLTQLPANMKAEDVLFSEAQAMVSIEATQGVKADVTLVSNPGYRGFNSTETGLKEFIDQLLASEPAVLTKIEGLVKRLDDFAHKYTH